VLPLIGNKEFVMGKNTSVVPGEANVTFIQRGIESGRFGTASEAMREALILLEERELKMEALRRAIDEGLESGDYQEINIEDYFVDAAA
jgi:antitoxin ParD1/3/4